MKYFFYIQIGRSVWMSQHWPSLQYCMALISIWNCWWKQHVLRLVSVNTFTVWSGKYRWTCGTWCYVINTYIHAQTLWTNWTEPLYIEWFARRCCQDPHYLLGSHPACLTSCQHKEDLYSVYVYPSSISSPAIQIIFSSFTQPEYHSFLFERHSFQLYKNKHINTVDDNIWKIFHGVFEPHKIPD